MNEVKVYRFLETNKDVLFPNDLYTRSDVEKALLAAPDSFEATMNKIPFRKPLIICILSYVWLDRFYMGDVKMGLLKIFTFGGCFIWWLIDLFTAKKRCRAYNCKKLIEAVSDPSVVGKMLNTDDKIKRAGVAAVGMGKVIKKGVKDFQDTL